MPFTAGCYALATISIMGLPPFSGFVGKFALLGASLASLPHAPLLHVGLFIVGLLLSGLAGLIAVAFPQVNLFAMFLLFLSDPLRRLISRRLKPLPSTAS